MKTLNSLEDLNTFAANVDQQIGSLDNRINGLKTAFKSGVVGAKEEKKRTYAQFGNLLKGIAKRSYGNKLSQEEVDILERAPRAVKDEGEPIVKAAMATDLVGDSTTGSYNLPVELWDEIQTTIEQSSELLPLVRQVPMKHRQKNIAVEADDIDFTYVASQSGDTTEANPTFAQETLTAYTYAAYVGVSEEFMEDEATGIGDYLTQIVGMAYSRKFDAEFLTGSGSPVTGLMNDTGVQAVSMSDGASGFSDVTINDFYNMEAELSETNGALQNAGWIMSPYCWNLIKRQVDAMGRPLIVDSFNNQAMKSIIGYPVHLSYQAPASSSDGVSTAFVGLGNYRKFIYGNRIGLEIKYFPNTHYMVTNCEAFWRFRFRAAFVISLPGNFAVLSTAA